MAKQLGGMEDVIAAQTAIASIDGERGELRYRGYSIADLAGQYSFEDVAYLLWTGELPSAQEAEQNARQIRELRVQRADLIDLVTSLPERAHPLDVLRFAVSYDALGNQRAWENSVEANLRKAQEFTAWFPVVAAAYHRVRSGLQPVAPHPDLDSAANFLYMVHGAQPSDVTARTLDTSFVLHAEHELNASTFAARVTIATQSNVHAAVASALGTLAGPRHGGASERIISMLEQIGTPDAAEGYVAQVLAKKERVMGYGHRVYRTADPRSRHLSAMAEEMLRGAQHQIWMEILAALSDVMARQKQLYPNVDLYAAVVNHELGIDPAFYTSVFACSRITGWTAHAIEQLSGRMIRPAAEYIGVAPRRPPVAAAH